MGALFRWLAAVIFGAVVVQVGLAGYGAFHAIHRADGASISKKAIEHGFDAHAALGTALVIAMLVLVIAAAVGHLGRSHLISAGVLFGLGVVQAILGGVSTSAPVLGALHAVNALAIFAVSGLIAHRAFAGGRRSAAAASAPGA